MKLYVAFLLCGVFAISQAFPFVDKRDHEAQYRELVHSGGLDSENVKFYFNGHSRTLRHLREKNDPDTIAMRAQLHRSLEPIKIGIMREGREHFIEPFKRHHHKKSHHKKNHHKKHHHVKRHHGKHHVKHHGKHHNKHHGHHHVKHHGHHHVKHHRHHHEKRHGHHHEKRHGHHEKRHHGKHHSLHHGKHHGKHHGNHHKHH